MNFLTSRLYSKKISIQVYNLHRSPYFWDRPDEFKPERFSVKKNSDIEGWAGFDPSRSPGAFYPNEVSYYLLLVRLPFVKHNFMFSYL